jgi:hypothetical protein
MVIVAGFALLWLLAVLLLRAVLRAQDELDEDLRQR